MEYQFHFEVFRTYWPWIAKGLGMTLYVSIIAMFFALLIGLVVGALAIQGSLKGPGTVLLAAPLAVWSIPIFDSAIAILRRKLAGRSIYDTDRGHLHHRLLSLLGSRRLVAEASHFFGVLAPFEPSLRQRAEGVERLLRRVHSLLLSRSKGLTLMMGKTTCLTI